jgi:hypothetical protein
MAKLTESKLQILIEEVMNESSFVASTALDKDAEVVFRKIKEIFPNANFEKAEITEDDGQLYYASAKLNGSEFHSIEYRKTKGAIRASHPDVKLVYFRTEEDEPTDENGEWGDDEFYPNENMGGKIEILFGFKLSRRAKDPAFILNYFNNSLKKSVLSLKKGKVDPSKISLIQDLFGEFIGKVSDVLNN